MGEIVGCPEGVEIDFVIYLTSESTGIDVRFALKGMTAFVGFEKACDPAALAVASGASRFAPDWRMMTRAEIAEYKRGEESDDSEAEGGSYTDEDAAADEDFDRQLEREGSAGFDRWAK